MQSKMSIFEAYWLVFLSASAVAIPQRDFYSFGAAAGDVSVPRGDDNSSPVVFLPIIAFPYYGQFHNQLFVNTNGHITFFSSSGAFVPEPFPLADNLQLITPYWVDLDTRNPLSGLVWYRIATDSTTLGRAATNIQRAFPNLRPFTLTWLLVATWDHVGRYDNEVDVRSTFQCVLATDGQSSFVMFLYADGGIEWDFSGQVGLNAGDGIRFFSHPDSFSSRLTNIHTTSNIGIPGVWIFKVDGEEVVSAGCSTGNNIPITLTPRYGHLFGGTPVIVTGPCFSATDSIQCMFGDTKQQSAKFISEESVLCVSPLLTKIGSTKFTLIIKQQGDEIMFESTFLAASPDRAHVVNVITPSLMVNALVEATIQWTPEDIIPNYIPKMFNRSVNVDVLIFSQKYERTDGGKNWQVDWINVKNAGMKEVPLLSGKTMIKFPKLESDCILPLHDRTQSITSPVCPIAIKVSISESLNRNSELLLPSNVGVWSGVHYLDTENMMLRTVCEKWGDEEKESGFAGPNLLDMVVACPPMELLARNDRDYQIEEMTSLFRETNFREKFMGFFHSGIAACYRQSTPTPEGLGQQCCYKSDGNLVKGESAGGSVDTMSPNVDYNRHISDDVVPYITCCQAADITSTKCDEYYQWRPSGTETGYTLPVPACIYGDPHIVTLDGLKYTFNGKGEFTLIETLDDSFTLQGRMDTILDQDNNPTPGTVFTALVARQHQTNTTVQFDLRPTGFRVQLNGNTLNFEDLPQIATDFVTITDNGNSSVSAFFSEGAKMELKTENGIISVMLIILPNSLNGMTRGLMGNFNSDKSDDLIPKSETESISTNLSIENIHQLFGVTWILRSQSESYFTYMPGQSFSAFYDPLFVPIFEPSFDNIELEEQARNVCGDDEFCLFDIAATKNVDIGMATMQGGEEFNEILEMAIPIVCDPPCVSGTCVQNNTCSCSEGYEGDICDTAVVLGCDVNICENNGTCSIHVRTYTCDCPDGFIGAFCQEREPEFGISLINSSPRVTGGAVIIDFTTNRPISFAQCFLTGQTRRNCGNSGHVEYKNLLPGSYVFRISAISLSGKRAVLRRAVHVGESGDTDFCAVHLINEGIVIDQTSVSLFFQSTSAVDYNLCRLKGNNTDTGLSRCRSPVRHHDLALGDYQFQVIPVGCSKEQRLSVRFKII